MMKMKVITCSTTLFTRFPTNYTYSSTNLFALRNKKDRNISFLSTNHTGKSSQIRGHNQYKILSSLNTSVIAYDEIIKSSSSSSSTFTILFMHGLLGCGNDFADFAHSLASSLSDANGFTDWRMVLVDLRNHGRSTDIEGLSPPHDTINAAKDIANLVKSLDWAWPDVVIGHSLGGKVAYQYALSVSQGDYGDSAQLPKQVWVLDAVPGKLEDKSRYDRVAKALYSLKTLPAQIPSKEWLVDHLIDLGLPEFFSEWIGSSLKKSGEHEILSFNIDGAVEMFKSIGDMDYWALLEHPPKGTEIDIVRTDGQFSWAPDVVERLESLAKRETDESTGRVSVHVISNSGHWIYRDQPQVLLEIMTPKIASRV